MKYEVKYDLESEDFWYYNKESPEDAYQEFLEDNDEKMEVPVVVWCGLEKVAEFIQHIGIAKLKEEEEAEAEKKIVCDLTLKIKTNSFQKLNSQEVEVVGEVMDEVLTAKTESQEKLDLVRVTLMDEQAYKFYTLRSNTRSILQQEAMLKAMNVNLSDISNKTGGIKTASMFTGMAAARHLGEEIAEDFGGGDE